MARATSGLGQFRGKVGSVVFRVNQGKQIASAYQPVVKNPKSNLQTAQRNKMYLASQISKLVPKEDIIGLDPLRSVRDRRSLFIRSILDNAVSSYRDGVFDTELMATNITFSNGQNIEGVTYNVSESTNNYAVTLTFDTNVISEEQFNRLAFKLIQFEIVNNSYSNYKSSYIDLGTYNTEGQDNTFNVQVNVSRNSKAGAAIYIVPVVLNDNIRYSSQRKTLIELVDTDIFSIGGVYNTSRAILKWYKSMLIYSSSAGDFIPPAGGGAEVVNPDGPSFPNLG